MNSNDTGIFSLGPSEYSSPLDLPQFIDEGERVIVDVVYDKIRDSFKNATEAPSFENAGPRRKIYFNPAETRAAIVTCGGLCPGLNNVIKSLVHQLCYQYKIPSVSGIRYGYEGLNPAFGHEMMVLNPDIVEDIHEKGGTILGSSRGNQDVPTMVDTLVKHKINILFTIGGDGTLHGAQEIFNEINKRGLKIAVVGIPKTIDNDINYIDKTFGFETAVSIATEVIKGAHSEAKGARNGIGLVKLMGRDSGFIAAYTALASNEVNYVLIPEVKFNLYGETGLLNHLHQRLIRKAHAVIVVAEGAGQEYFSAGNEKDASGNALYKDIGIFLKDEISRYFKEKQFHVNIKYIDPSYTIRSMPANADDAVFCIMLAQNAVHAAMAGKSGCVIGRWNSYFVFVPIAMATAGRKKIDPKGYLWTIVKETTGQPDFY
jgi:6-phosphofructokinase 1